MGEGNGHMVCVCKDMTLKIYRMSVSGVQDMRHVLQSVGGNKTFSFVVTQAAH